MTSIIVQDRAVEADLSKLIDFSVTFQPLQLTLQDILQRLAAVEDDNRAKSQQIHRLSEELARLQRNDDDDARKIEDTTSDSAERLSAQERQPRRDSRGRPASTSVDDGTGRKSAGSLHGRGLETAVAHDAAGASEEMDAVWAELHRLGGLLGDLQEAAQRYSIDELYAARKRHPSHVASVKSPRQSSAALTGDDSRGASAAAPRQGSVPQASPRTESATATTPAAQFTSIVEETAEKPDWDDATGAQALGDVILSKAQEVLPLDDTVPYHAGTDEGASEDAGEHMQPPPRHPSGPASTPAEEGESRECGGSTPPASALQRTGGSVSRSASAISAPAQNARLLAQRRSSVRPSCGPTPGSHSVFDALKRDGEDIAYLNRVVAEILSEMKGLHADVDLLRTQSEVPLSRLLSADAEGNVRVDQDTVAALLRRLGDFESALAQVDRSSQRRDGDLSRAMDELRGAMVRRDEGGAGPADIPDADLAGRVAALEHEVDRLRDKLDHVVRASNGSGDGAGGVSAVTPAELALLQGAVASLEKQLAALQREAVSAAGAAASSADRGVPDGGAVASGADSSAADDTLTGLRRALQALEDRVRATEAYCAELQEMKLDKSDLPVSRKVTDGAEEVEEGGGAEEEGEEDVEVMRRLTQLGDRLDEAERRLKRVEGEKADNEALHRLREELGNLKRLMELNAQREASGRGHEDGDTGGEGGNTAALQRLLREMQQTLDAQLENATTDRDAVREELDGLRELIDQLDHRKADATLVANKAERDYVENALERLMREVEQVLNATNAGLIDTLDKSLNILRDMIDGKATKQDIANLQQMMAEDGAGHGAADALTGFKGYRCLGCNRAVDNFRPRPLPTQMDSFLNRNPQSYPQDHVTRVIQQQQQQQQQQASPAYGGAILDQRQTAAARQANSGSQRSTHSEPLPPIEHAR